MVDGDRWGLVVKPPPVLFFSIIISGHYLASSSCLMQGLTLIHYFRLPSTLKSSIKPHGDLKFISSPCEGKEGGLIEIVGLFNSEKNDGISSP